MRGVPNRLVKLTSDERVTLRRAQRAATYQRGKTTEFRQKIRDRNHLWNYGVSIAEKDRLFVAQGSVCAICGTDDPGAVKGWHTDHDHSTHKIRGVLCHGCNIKLGFFENNPDFHLQAALYLEKHNGT
jgi:hypothetical protein